jgi:formate hydrogenlyase subunit 4
MTNWWLASGQAALYVALAPLSVGLVQWLKARLQGRRGPGPLQPYRDLRKLLRIAPNVPSSTSVVFLLAPPTVFTCFVLLGLALPVVAGPAGSGIDLLLVVGLLGLAKFVSTLAAFDAASPLGPLSSGRQWFIHVLAEPAMLVAIYVFAMSRHTTTLPLPAPAGGIGDRLMNEPTIPLAIGALGFVLLAESGRLPFDNPVTHLELTMIEEGTKLEYGGRALALMKWADAMKLSFALSLVAFLAVPAGTLAPVGGAWRPLAAFGEYLAKMALLLVLLAWWETSRGKMRLKAVVTPLMLATGILLFTVVTLVVTYIQPGS